MSKQLQATIDAAWDKRDTVNSATKGEIRDAVEAAIAGLDDGSFRTAEKVGNEWVVNQWLKTRISPEGWTLVPVPPAEAAAQISPVPLLIVHGDKDHYFPPEHARQLYGAAREPKDLWLIPGMGHAEAACNAELVDRIGDWIAAAIAPSRVAADQADDIQATSRPVPTPLPSRSPLALTVF